MKDLLRRGGRDGRQVVFLFTDSQLKLESFLEDINNILNKAYHLPCPPPPPLCPSLPSYPLLPAPHPGRDPLALRARRAREHLRRAAPAGARARARLEHGGALGVVRRALPDARARRAVHVRPLRRLEHASTSSSAARQQRGPLPPDACAPGASAQVADRRRAAHAPPPVPLADQLHHHRLVRQVAARRAARRRAPQDGDGERPPSAPPTIARPVNHRPPRQPSPAPVHVSNPS